MKKIVFISIFFLLLTGCSFLAPTPRLPAAALPVKQLENLPPIEKNNILIINQTAMLFPSRAQSIKIIRQQSKTIAADIAAVNEIYDLFEMKVYNFIPDELKKIEAPKAYHWSLYNLAGIGLAQINKNAQALSFFDKAIDLGRTGKHQKSQLIVLLNKTNLLYESGNLVKAENLYKKIIAFAKQSAFLQLQAAASANASLLFLSQKDFRKSLYFSSAALSINKRLKDPPVSLISKFTKGKIYYFKNEYKQDDFNEQPYTKAITFLKEALKTSRTLEQKQYEAELINLFGLISIEVGILEDAEKIFEKALLLSDEIAYTKGKVDSLCGLGTVAFITAEDSTFYFTETLRLSEEISYTEGLVESYIGMAKIAREEEKYTDSLNYFNNAYTLTKKNNDSRKEAAILSEVGYTYYKIDDLSNAINYYKNALRINTKNHFKKGKVNNLTYIGLLHRLKGENHIAMDFSRQALSSSEGILFRWEKSISLNNIGNIYITTGHRANAKKYFVQSLQLSKIIGDKTTTRDNISKLEYLSPQVPDFAAK